MAKRTTSAPTKYEGDLGAYKSRYLRCRGRRRHPFKVRGHINIVVKSGRILEFTEELLCQCGVRCEVDYEVVSGRFVRKGTPRMDYSGAPGYLFERDSKYGLDEARDELLTRELMASLQGDALEALFRTKNVGDQTARHLRAV